jgi:quercetin dioxygenase-like cupin family protein
MSQSKDAVPTIVNDADAEKLWFLGTLVQIKLDGRATAGRLGVFEALFPRGASPPLHSHPQDETFYVLDGEVTVWADGPPRLCRRGGLASVPGGTPHSFRVESDTARMLIMSTPAGIEEFVRALAGPAEWPWLQPPPDGPRMPIERIEAAEREHAVARHGPPPEG